MQSDEGLGLDLKGGAVQSVLEGKLIIVVVIVLRDLDEEAEIDHQEKTGGVVEDVAQAERESLIGIDEGHEVQVLNLIEIHIIVVVMKVIGGDIGAPEIHETGGGGGGEADLAAEAIKVALDKCVLCACTCTYTTVLTPCIFKTHFLLYKEFPQ